MVNRGKIGSSNRFYFLCSKITADCHCSHEIKRCLFLERKAMTNLDNVTKYQRYHFAHKDLYSKSYGFSSSHVQMWELFQKEGWALKNWCFWIVVLEKTLESLLDCKKIKSSILKKSSWIVIGKTVAEAEAPVLWLPNAKDWLIRKGPESGKAGKQKEKGVGKDERGG